MKRETVCDKESMERYENGNMKKKRKKNGNLDVAVSWYEFDSYTI